MPTVTAKVKRHGTNRPRFTVECPTVRRENRDGKSPVGQKVTWNPDIKGDNHFSVVGVGRPGDGSDKDEMAFYRVYFGDDGSLSARLKRSTRTREFILVVYDERTEDYYFPAGECDGDVVGVIRPNPRPKVIIT